jgi:hypothetical protein
MTSVRLLVVSMILAGAPAAFAQRWEFGGGAGGGFYTGKDITSPAGTASAKINTGIAASAWVGQTGSKRLGGELRYDYSRGDLALNGNGQQATFGSETHAMHYDLLWHFAKSPEAHVRPYVLAGAGVKIYRGTGEEQITQPLSKIALLTHAQDLVALVSVGTGIKMQLSDRIQLRLELHDFLTPFPKQVITPALNASGASGWINDFVPMIGLSWVN